METKPLLFGLIGFFLGGFIVSVAATIDPPHVAQTEVTMSAMKKDLENARGEAFDRLYIDHMIAHHEAAVDMADVAKTRASHPELRAMSADVVHAQAAEIDQMKLWQKDWGYLPSHSMHHQGH